MLNRIFLLFLLCCTAALNAAEINNLYRVEVPVADQGQAERNRAIQVGFKQVLVKVTGNRNIDQKNALKSEYQKASRYVQQYRYRLQEKTVSGMQADETRAEKRFLQVSFDKLAVDRMLRERGLPVWGKSRPQVLAWVGFEDKRKRKLLIPEFNPKVVSMLNSLSDDRGIPFLLPLMDLEDQSAVSTSDLWGAFENPIRNASERYEPDIILLVTIKSVSGNAWVSNWSLLDGEDTRSWEFRDKQLFTVLQNGMYEMSDLLAQTYAPAGGNQTQVLNMQIDSVKSFADLLRVQRFLESQETVQGFQVRAIQNDRLILSLNLRGGAQAFIQAVNLSGFLLPDDGALLIPEVQEVESPDIETKGTENQLPEQAGQLSPVVNPLVADIQLFYQMR